MGKHNHWLQKCIVYWLLIFKKNQRFSRPNYWLFSTHPTRKITVIFPIQLKNSRLFSTHSTQKITDFFTHRTKNIADCFYPIPLQKSPKFFTHPTIKSPIFSATRLTNPMGKCCYPFQVPSPLLAQDLVPLFLHRFLLLLLLHDHVCSSIEPTLAIFVSQSLHVDHQSSLEDMIRSGLQIRIRTILSESGPNFSDPDWDRNVWFIQGLFSGFSSYHKCKINK